jgi:hypothetical protein
VELESLLLWSKHHNQAEHAAYNLLISALGKEVIYPDAPWIQVDGQPPEPRVDIDVSKLLGPIRFFPAEKQKIVSVAASLLDANRPISLADLTGLNPRNAELVQTAIAYTMGVMDVTCPQLG